jgi:catechol-2,3-dioxygenase
MATQVSAPAKSSDPRLVSPSRLAHVVLRTSQIKEMMRWYKLVLNAETAFENDEIAFISYDDEHHRVAFVNIPGLGQQPDGIVGLHHVAFTYGSLKELLGHYERLSEHGILPQWCINHGPTTSMYYEDPDRNQLEFQIDNFDTVEEAGEFFYTEAFATNTIGVDFDPADLLERSRAGEDEAALKTRPPSGPRGVDTIRIR